MADFSIVLTSGAQAQAIKLKQQTPEWQGKCLRLYLAGKGCDGFNYGVCFDDREEGDLSFMQGEIEVIVDTPAFEFVKGSTLEWVDDERGQGFLVENPKHRSFRGKFYKRKFWQEKLTGAKAQQEEQPIEAAEA